jgi:hypothetical protein
VNMTSGHLARTPAAAVAFVLVAALSHPALGQPAPPIGPGARVRVSHTDRCCASPQKGALVSVSVDSVVIRTSRQSQTDVIPLPRRAVSSFALGYQSGRHTGRGATIGAVTGVLVGAGLGLTSNCEDDDICKSFRPLYAGIGGVLVGAAGLVLGTVIGYSIVREEWVPVPLPERVGIAPTPGGGLAVRLALRL